MIKETPETVREWLVNEDIETLIYQLSGLFLESGYQIIETNSVQWAKHQAQSWILDDGMAFLRSFNGSEKLFLEVSSFAHDKHLKFVISLRQLVLERSKGLLR